MKKAFSLLFVDLKLHDGAVSGAAGAAPAAQTTEAEAPQAGITLPGSSRRGKSGEARESAGFAPRVIYGKQADTEASGVRAAPAAGEPGLPTAAPTTATSNTAEARKAEFEKLISGEYKDLFTERTQQVIDRRFKETKGLQEKLESLSPLLDTLGQKYKVTDGDPKKLVEAFEKDGKFVEELAEEEGLTVAQWKEMQKLQRENKQLMQAQQEQRAKGQYAKWVQDAAELQKAYPAFDLGHEAANPQFTSMLRAGVPLQTAYEALHINEVKANVAQTVGQRVEQNVSNNIRAKGTRPTEAGVSAQTGVLVKSDVSKLTSADRREIARRAARGEAISF